MSLDNDLKRAFERHASDVSPAPGAWSGVERRIRRSHRLRTALATAGSAAAVVAAALVVPSVLTDQTTPRPEPPATEPPVKTEDTYVFRSERDGYWAEIPKSWRFGEFEAHVSFRPPGVPSPEEGRGQTFSLELWTDVGKAEDFWRRGGYPAKDETIAGRPAKVVEAVGVVHSDGTCPGGCPNFSTTTRTYFVDWTGYQCAANAPCPVANPTTLTIIIFGEQTLWDRHLDTAASIVKSLRLNNSSTMPRNASVATRRGTVNQSVEYDQATSSVVKFMDARMDGGGAEGWLTSNAKQQYDKHEGGLSLYSPDERNSYTSYKVVSRERADANSWQFIVEIEALTTSGPGGSEMRHHFREILGVGPVERTPAMIRFAMRETLTPR